MEDEVGGRLGPVEELVSQVADYAIIRLDPDGTIRTWNLGAERVKGYTAEEAVGRSFEVFYTEADRADGLPWRLLATARDKGRVEHVGWRMRRDGSRFWADVVLTALRDESGRLTGFAKVTRDLTEQHDLEVRLRASEERLRLLVGQVADYAIIALGPTGTIETWNLGAERVKGYTAEEAIGQDFSIFYTAADREAGLPERLLEQARRNGRVEHRGWRVRKDGSRFWGEALITALHDEDGHLTGFAKVTRDRSDVKALEDAQDAFYAGFRHDFRTPVTAINGFAEALRDADPDTQEYLVDRIQANTERLMGMVDGLVHFAQERRTHADLTLEPLDVAEVARGVVDDLAPAYGSGRVHVAPGPAPALADSGALHRVLTNLVVNAVKYSEAGTPVEVTFDAPAPGRTAFTVEDRGRGIHADDVATILDSFQRGRLATADGGTGLGLTSVRDLVRQQDGSVLVRSELGRGTSVTIELPAPVKGQAGDRSQPAAGSSGTAAGQPSG
ncbi:PAS domain-containing sensor histidine kinase [Nocardioides korecus]